MYTYYPPCCIKKLSPQFLEVNKKLQVNFVYTALTPTIISVFLNTTQHENPKTGITYKFTTNKSQGEEKHIQVPEDSNNRIKILTNLDYSQFINQHYSRVKNDPDRYALCIRLEP